MIKDIKTMWKNNNTNIDLSMIDKSEFKMVSLDGLTLIVPRKNKFDWRDDEKWLRSVVVNDVGDIVSCSWPKFGNYGEFSDDTDILNTALATKKIVRFCQKEDGTLLIRSVINEKVILRTRGTLYGGEYDEDGNEPFRVRFQRVAEKKYPMILDASWMSERSLLFEYVAPNNRIVIQYATEDLIFLGAIYHNCSINTWQDTIKIALSGNLNLVNLHSLSHDPIKLLLEIENWESEGIVVRCENSQVLVKVKSAKYLAKHRMKFSMNYKFMVEFIELSTITDETGLIKKLQECDYDWETIESAKTFYERYLVACKIQNDAMKVARKLHSRFMADVLPDWAGGGGSVATRKEYAQLACAQSGIIRPMMFCLYDDKIDKLNALHKKIIITEGKGK